MNTTQAQQKALDDALVAPADHLEFGKCNMRLKTDIKPKEATFQFCPKIPEQVFEDLPLEQDILSFIRDLGHTGDITYLTDGMFHKKNIDYVYLLWEDLLFQIEYKDAKKTNKMSYPKFTNIIIDYFKSKDPSISRRNKMFWHTARDDTLFTSIRCIPRHEDTQVYGTILPTELTNQAMLESKAYQTCYAFDYGEKAPKPKYTQKKADLDTSPKKKPVQSTKGTRIKSKAKVALTRAEQIKLVTKRSKKDFHVSQASGSGDGVDTQSKSWGDSKDEDDNDNEGDNDDDGESDDHDDDNDDERAESDRDEIPDPKLTNVDQTEHEEEEYDDEFYDEGKLDDKETMDDE
ncbi:hypothetical protein Tco_0349032 [Tanacetum coccineum]